MTDFRCFKIAPDIRLKYRVYPGLFFVVPISFGTGNIQHTVNSQFYRIIPYLLFTSSNKDY